MSDSFSQNITEENDENTYTEEKNINEESLTTNDTNSSNSEESEDYENEDEVSFKEPQDPAEFMDYFEDLMQRTRVRLEEVFEQYMPQLIQMSSSVALSPDCTYDAVRILFGLRKLKPWAIKSKFQLLNFHFPYFSTSLLFSILMTLTLESTLLSLNRLKYVFRLYYTNEKKQR
jgi:hypothetical protein